MSTMHHGLRLFIKALLTTSFVLGTFGQAYAADKALLDILLENKIITQVQHESLLKKESLTQDDLFVVTPTETAAAEVKATTPSKEVPTLSSTTDVALGTDEYIKIAVADAVAARIDKDFPVTSRHTSNGFRFESRDGNGVPRCATPIHSLAIQDNLVILQMPIHRTLKHADSG